jgi:hypothetical protein
MNGPQHYAEAERLVAHSKNHTDQGNPADDTIAALAATQAQVHASLALTAATAAGRSSYQNENNRDEYIHGDQAWNEVTS